MNPSRNPFINTPIMELGSQNHSRHGLLGPNSIMVVYMDSLGMVVSEEPLGQALSSEVSKLRG